ncbi:MAG: hypothetical protein KME25_25290 [Symplocastrum torsivum CPER-KK1]|jgi:hypothetical protein|uniref:GIY-YIG domain-containing protein n=1 Tax=Symplocastrum torsivum CPER-KK1 TaxID=450513 RepID=A0A951PQZ8_9CYAN|nr:hypothetical protein [Symplocastrum torsivum CPER-KK1]
MNADEYILQLCHIALKSRELLPEQSGIYYVLDEKSIIWYIGQAKNLRIRWAGESHHRLYQLQKQRKKQLTIYYELVAKSQLDAIERQRIEQYNPQLNGTKVSKKKLRPTETLLREMLIILAPYSFVLGVEYPRKEDLKFIEDSIYWQDEWRVQKAVLSLNVIHVCINLSELGEAIKDKDWLSMCRFLRKVFRKRSNYSGNWACKGKISYEYSGMFFLRRLLVNGFAIEVYVTNQEAVELIKGYELTQLAGVKIRSISDSSLAVIKNRCQLRVVGMYVYSDYQNQPYDQYRRSAIERLYPYKEDLVKLLFNEDLDTNKLQISPIESQTTDENNPGLPVRLANLTAKKEYLRSLLTERGLNLNRYQVNKYLERIPTDDSYIDSQHDRRMTVYVKSFGYSDLRKPIYYSSHIYGSKGHSYQSQNLLDCPYEEVYLASTVDRAFWLLLETYLSDFAKVKLNEEEGYIDKVYISARKFLVPARLTITLNGKWKADIPFGSKDNMSGSEVANIIKSRLQESGMPQLKFSFQSESTRT